MGKLARSQDIQDLNETNKGIRAALEVMAGAQLASLPTDIKAIQRLVRQGLARSVLTPGDKIYVPWIDYDNSNKEYNVAHDILGFRDIELPSGEVVKDAPCISWHYGIPYDMPFDAQEAFYYAEEGLAAGTYNITVGANWGTYCKTNESYQFTLTKAVPAGGQLIGFYGMPYEAPSTWRVSSYNTASELEALETVTVSAGSGGTNLGTFTPAGSGNVNSLHRLAYGSGRWGQSFFRQWHNSKGTGFYKPSNKFDHIPGASYSGKHGFMSGYSDEFLSCTGPVKVRTALNTVNESSEGTYEDTYDTFFPLSLEESYIVPQISGVEGAYFEYWKRAVNSPTPAVAYQDGAYPILTGVDNTSAARVRRLRSASRGGAYTAWHVSTAGHVSYYVAVNAFRSAPACFIF